MIILLYKKKKSNKSLTTKKCYWENFKNWSSHFYQIFVFILFENIPDHFFFWFSYYEGFLVTAKKTNLCLNLMVTI